MKEQLLLCSQLALSEQSDLTPAGRHHTPATACLITKAFVRRFDMVSIKLNSLEQIEIGALNCHIMALQRVGMDNWYHMSM